MARPLAKSPFVLLALGLLILACPAALPDADDDDADSLNQQVQKLSKEGKSQDAIPLGGKSRCDSICEYLAEKSAGTAKSLDSLAMLYYAMHDYAKAEPLYQQALRDQAEGSRRRTSRHSDQPY